MRAVFLSAFSSRLVVLVLGLALRCLPVLVLSHIVVIVSFGLLMNLTARSALSWSITIPPIFFERQERLLTSQAGLEPIILLH